MGISFPVLPEAESPTRFTLLGAWLRWCDKFHYCMNDAAKSETALPTRLLYVGDPDPNILRLYCPKENQRLKYVALSHCWGEHPPTKDSPRFCTTDDNIETRLKRFGFSELPKTFQDAVRNDWGREAKRMEDVFASAYCTIAATSAANSEAGFLKRSVSTECVLVQDASGGRFYICADTDDSNNHVDIDDFNDHVEKAPLNTRAWVMQERILSRRTIYFSDKQMYWECSKGIYCETLTKLNSSLRKTYFTLDSNFPDRLLKSGDRRTTEFLRFFSEEYSKRDLTKETDRCFAASGLEARIAGAMWCQSRYDIFGMYLHRNLLWQRSAGEKTPRIGYEPGLVPSWSWMAYGGSIRFMEIPFGDVDWAQNLRFIEEEEGKKNHVLLTDVGVFWNCSLEQRDASYAVLDSSKVERGQIWYDIEVSIDPHTERCIVVGRNSPGGEHGSSNKYYILVVRRTSVDDEYTRVGVGWVDSDYVFRSPIHYAVSTLHRYCVIKIR
ncbi:heterokaryon incompatibility protein-domain-containing protein [Xylaria bambusicola]|uniref:heterokaryon incompatibility protein-domain-containing protein n=1 Tax=Xylaria bambusicola TaxID=326684 RepID=UPI0020079BE8|nr:heterokaryon incompatibility protein-domain-containing protein [Xylaria bambusicola]KAI0506833.1 heterokaryon incompatibility protein-domain-containing protein [Xylaria bambusicola]